MGEIIGRSSLLPKRQLTLIAICSSYVRDMARGETEGAVIEIGFLDGLTTMRIDRESKFAKARGEAPPGAAPSGQALASLLSSDLRERFYSWRGLSGRRYICSVFSAAEVAVVSEFTAAVVIGVANKVGAPRRPVCVMSSREFHVWGDIGSREGAESHGVSEWHVHFGVDDEGLRDLAGSLLS
jgi:hypothetical protein